jgi:glycerol uptake facilitator-like aquaporin
MRRQHAGVAITVGLVIMAMIYAVGHVSGAHFNLVAGALDDVWIYFIACPLGAAAAALLYQHLILAHRE